MNKRGWIDRKEFWISYLDRWLVLTPKFHKYRLGNVKAIISQVGTVFGLFDSLWSWWKAAKFQQIVAD